MEVSGSSSEVVREADGREEGLGRFEGTAYVTCAQGDRVGPDRGSDAGRGYGDSPSEMEDVQSVAEVETKEVEEVVEGKVEDKQPPRNTRHTMPLPPPEHPVMVTAVPFMGYPATYGPPLAPMGMVGMPPPPQLVLCPSPFMYCPICAGMDAAAAAQFHHQHYSGPPVPKPAGYPVPMPRMQVEPIGLHDEGEMEMDGPPRGPPVDDVWDDGSSYDSDDDDDGYVPWPHRDHGITPPGGGC